MECRYSVDQEILRLFEVSVHITCSTNHTYLICTLFKDTFSVTQTIYIVKSYITALYLFEK
jgi:hypothetical protein